MSEVRNSSEIKFYHAINSKVQMKTIALGTNRRVVIEADIREFENEAVMAHQCWVIRWDNFTSHGILILSHGIRWDKIGNLKIPNPMGCVRFLKVKLATK